MAQQSHDPKGELVALVEKAGGLAALAEYLETSPEMLEIALGAPAGKRTDKVCAMVEENTRKLLLMPSRRGWIWKVTRRRVVKDWLILARWSEANGGVASSAVAPARELSEDELRAEIGDKAPPGYVWVDRDEVLKGALPDEPDVDDPEELARAVQFCVNHNVEPVEMALMFELGFLQEQPQSIPMTEGGLPVLPWAVIQRKLEERYGIEPGEAWTEDAEARFRADVLAHIAGTLDDSELTRIYQQMLDPQLIRTYVQIEDPELRRTCWRLMALSQESEVSGEELFTAFSHLNDYAQEVGARATEVGSTSEAIPEDTTFDLFEPDASSLDQLTRVDLTTLLAWGIVNPFGPTLNAITLAGEFEAGEELPILRVMLNPFAQQVELIGLARMGSTWNLLEDFQPLFALESGACPTVLLAGNVIDEDKEVALFAQLLETFPEGAATLERVRRFPGDPWNRITEEVEGASGMLAEYQQTGQVAEEEAKYLSPEEAHELASTLLNTENQGQEFAAFFSAWQGSIDFQRGNSVAQEALAFDDFVAYFSLLADSCRLPSVGEDEDIGE